MQFQSEKIDDILVVSVPNIDIDADNAEEFKKSAASVVNGHERVIMNLEGISFMDSAGLGAVLSVYKNVRGHGGRFMVYGLSPEVQALFDLVRIQRLFEVHKDRESAIRSVQL